MIGKRRKTWVGAIGLAVLLAVLFSGGRGVQKVDAVPKESYEGLETFTNILSIIQKNYVDEVQTKQLIEAPSNGCSPPSTPTAPTLRRTSTRSFRSTPKAASAASASRSPTATAALPSS